MTRSVVRLRQWASFFGTFRMQLHSLFVFCIACTYLQSSTSSLFCHVGSFIYCQLWSLLQSQWIMGIAWHCHSINVLLLQPQMIMIAAPYMHHSLIITQWRERGWLCIDHAFITAPFPSVWWQECISGLESDLANATAFLHLFPRLERPTRRLSHECLFGVRTTAYCRHSQSQALCSYALCITITSATVISIPDKFSTPPPYIFVCTVLHNKQMNEAHHKQSVSSKLQSRGQITTTWSELLILLVSYLRKHELAATFTTFSHSGGTHAAHAPRPTTAKYVSHTRTLS